MDNKVHVVNHICMPKITCNDVNDKNLKKSLHVQKNGVIHCIQRGLTNGNHIGIGDSK